MKRRKAFSLIEVIVSVSLLIMVGTAMSVLNATAVKLMTTNETLTMAYGLNDEAITFISLQRHNPNVANFDTYIQSLPGQADCDSSSLAAAGCTVYIACSDDIGSSCTLFGKNQKQAGIQLGRGKNSYKRSLKITKLNSSDYSLEAVTSWGNSVSQQVKVIKFLN